MFKVQVKLIISISLLSSDILTVYSQSFVGATTENVVVTIKNYLKPEELAAALNRDNQSEPAKDSAKQNARVNFAKTARAKTTSSMQELFICAISLDASCLIDHVEVIVDNANNDLLRQADAEARRMPAGRADSEEETTPSSLITSIAQMMLDLPELLKDSIGGMFRATKGQLGGEEDEEDESEAEDKGDEEDDKAEESEDDNESEEEEEGGEEEEEEDEPNDDEDKKDVKAKTEEDVDEDRKKCGKKGCSHGMGDGGGYNNDYGGNYGTAGREVGGGRGKKKKKKKAIVKLLLLGLIIKAKITLLLKMLAAKLQIKFLLIALANLLLNLARFWWDLKKGSGHEQPQKVIYYEHAQHQHHYDGGEDWQSSPGGGGYWGRAYDSEETSEKSAQDIAYAKQIPKGTAYSRIDDKPNISWNPWG